jgi:D-sedoheptulose 7-phosphate isomerase
MTAAAAIDERVACGERFFGPEAERLARLCHAMAERFARGGRLLAIGSSPADWSDARHVAVEFVHPVIVGKRALPAIAVAAGDVALLARADDLVMAFGDAPEVRRALRMAEAAGCLTVAFAAAGAQWDMPLRTDDPFVAQEQAETAYHVLWELVHVFFEHRGLLAGRDRRPHHDSGASAFLYPFLAETEDDLEAVIADVRESVLAKAAEAAALRAQTLSDNAETLAVAARAVGARLRSGGLVLALGNGGSATDAMDAVADLRHPPHGWRAWPALDLTEEAPVLTAVANDVGVDAMFVRQVIAYGGPGDALISFSTSGNSSNVIAALEEARRRGLVTIALVGYGGGRIAGEALADHVVVTRSEHIPRIQEAQASAWHVMRELLEAEAR